MKPKYPSMTQIIRHIVQIATFLLFPELFITVLHALGDVVTALTNSAFSVSALSAQLITLAAVFIITAVWGRFLWVSLLFWHTTGVFFLDFKKVFPSQNNDSGPA